MQVQVPVDWSGAGEVSTAHVNQFLVQVGPPTQDGSPDGIYIVLGNIIPPVILGESDEARQPYIDAAKAGIRVNVHGRFQFSRKRLDELIQALQSVARIYDAASQAADQQEAME